jgi:hypothetical protein
MHKTTGVMAGLILLAVAVGSTPAEPMAMDTLEVNITVAEWAYVIVDGDIPLIETYPDRYEGETGVSVAANFPYVLSAHWLDGAVWEEGASEVWHDDLSSPAEASAQTGYVRLWLYTFGGDPPEGGTEEGADAHNTAVVLFPDDEEAGIVQMTLTRDAE